MDFKKCGKGPLCRNSLIDTEGNLPISEFYTDKHKTTGYRSECKSCCNKKGLKSAPYIETRNKSIIEDYKNNTPMDEILAKHLVVYSTVYKVLKHAGITVDRREDLVGKRFTRLTVISKMGHSKEGRSWICRCDCGKETTVSTAMLNRGNTKSCGCLAAETARERFIKRHNIQREQKSSEIAQTAPIENSLTPISDLANLPELPRTISVNTTVPVIIPRPLRIEEKEWVGMPEFIQEQQRPYAKIIVRVGNEDALRNLAARLGQNLSQKTKSIWHPKLIMGVNSDKRWVDT